MGLISVRNLTLALAVSLVVISGGITGFMSITTGNKAVSDTRDVYSKGLLDTNGAADRGLNSAFDAGITNSRLLAEQLMAKVVDDMASQVQAYLEVPETAVEQIAHWAQQIEICTYEDGRFVPDCQRQQEHWMTNFLEPLMYSMFKKIAKKGVTELWITLYPMFNASFRNYVHSPVTSSEGDLNIPLDSDGTKHQQLVLAHYKGLCRPYFTKEECHAVGTQGDLPSWMPAEDWKAGNPPNGGCLWCEPDTDPAQRDKVPYAQNRAYYDVGQCSSSNACEYGFKPEAGFVDKQRNFLQISLIDEKGGPRDGPCQDLITSAEAGDLLGSTCPVPVVLASQDFGFTEAVTNKRHREEGRLLWGPVSAKGPMNNLLVYKAWDDRRMWDYGDLYGKLAGIVISSIDTSAMSRFMKTIVAALQPGTILYGVQQNPHFIREEPVNYECKDDRGSIAALAQIGCNILAGVLGCDVDIGTLSPSIKRFVMVHQICPVSCGTCPEVDAEGEGQGVMLGTTHGVAFAPRPLNSSSYGHAGLVDKYPMKIVDSLDPIVRSHGRYMLRLRSTRGLGWNALDADNVHEWVYEPSKAGGNVTLAGHFTQEVPAATGPEQLYWVKIKPIIQQEKALRLHFVLLILRDEAMKLIDEATTTTRAQAEAESTTVRNVIKRDSDQVDSDREENFNIMIGVVIGCCALLMAVSFVFVLSITRPLLELEYEMAEVATMKLEVIDTSREPHALEEVGNMQRSFFIMVKNLIEFRNYMPQSVLQDLEEDEEDEEQSVGGSRGSLSNVTPKGSRMGSRVGSQFSQSRRSSAGNKSSASKMSKMSVLLRDKKPQNSAMEAGLKKKNVSLLVVNLRAWHTLADGLTDAGCELHAMILSTILEILNPASKAVPETFCGDRMTISWNAVKACGTHRPKAIEVGDMIKKKLSLSEPIKSQLKGTTLEASIAAVTGEVKAGNAGCNGMKKFSFFSNNVTWLYALERVGKRLDVTFVADQFIFNETKDNYYYRTIELLNFVKRSPKDLTVHEMTGKKEAGEDEWMYQLEEGEKSDPNAKWNKYVAAVIKHDSETAASLLEAVQGSKIPERFVSRFTTEFKQDGHITPLQVAFH